MKRMPSAAMRSRLGVRMRGVAVTAEIAVTEIVGEDDDDVGRAGRGVSRWHKEEQGCDQDGAGKAQGVK